MAIARLGILAALCTVMVSDTLPQRKNIALHRPYTLTPAPNYTLSTDPEDAAQLTDGGYSETGFWPHKSTVGWTHVSPVSIVVDLGQDAPIAGASFDTAAGRAGVQFPSAIWVLVSVDGKQ